MKIVRGHSVAGDFCQNTRAARVSAIEIFQRKNGCAFPEDHSGAMPIKRAAFLRRRCLERIEPNKNQLRERVISAGQHALVAPRPHTLERMTNRVCAEAQAFAITWHGAEIPNAS